MVDSYGRSIDYLRVSVTDRCNLRCIYCMPDGIQSISMDEILTYEEITEACRQAAQLGISKIKLTGGEPLVRKGLPSLVKMLKTVEGIEQVTLTTNGVLLREALPELIDAGIDGVNISLDTMDGRQYEKITGRNELAKVLGGIDFAMRNNVPLKINTVVHEVVGQSMWLSLAELARSKSLDIRFIEIMPIGIGSKWNTVANRLIKEALEEKYGTLQLDDNVHGNGPAEYYKIEGFKGSIGFINSVHGGFCSNCNRLRLTSEGQLKPCLCFSDSFDLKKILRDDHYDEAKLRQIILDAVNSKPKGHCFNSEGLVSEKKEMNRIGG